MKLVKIGLIHELTHGRNRHPGTLPQRSGAGKQTSAEFKQQLLSRTLCIAAQQYMGQPFQGGRYSWPVSHIQEDA